MAPLCMACRIPLLSLLMFIFSILFKIQNASSLLMYDRLTLLKIRDFVNNLPVHGTNGHSNTPPPFLESIPAYLRCPTSPRPRKKRHKRRGKRGGILVHFKAYLASGDYNPRCSWNGPQANHVLVHHASLQASIFHYRRFLEYSYRWLRPAIPDTSCSLSRCRPVRFQRRGCVLGHLRPLNRATLQSESCAAVRIWLY